MTEQEAIHADAEQRLAELMRQRARVYFDSRYDPELRAELDTIDDEIDACRRVLAATPEGDE